MLEKHWRGEVLNSIEKAPGLARNMKRNEKNPVVKLIKENMKKASS